MRDGWFSYNWYQQCRHSLCNAHLLRDLTFVGESEPLQKNWTDDFGKLLVQIKSAVKMTSSQGENSLKKDQQRYFLDRYDSILADAERAIRGSPKVVTKQLSASSLHKRLVKNKTEILRFMTDFSMPFDNNGSERDLRMLKLQQKISGCFRTPDGAQTFCRVRSYVSSARKQGRFVLSTLESALKGQPIGLTT